MERLQKLLLGVLLLIPVAPVFADPPPWAPAQGYRAKQYRYVYYPERQIYYAPDSRLWFWFGGGQWNASVSLPVGINLGIGPGVSLSLDTSYPYERHDYVVERYGSGGQGGHRRH